MPRTSARNLTDAEIAALPTALARWMARRNVTCTELGELVSFSPVHLSRLRNAASGPSPQAMTQIARVTARWDLQHPGQRPTPEVHLADTGSTSWGVPPASWFATPAPAAPAAPAAARTSSRARGR